MAVIDEIIAFRDEREWGQYHSPRELAAAIGIEAGELQECFLWGRPWDHDAACQEVADVLIFALTMCHELGVSPDSIIRRKLEMNAEKYPAEQWRGRAWR